MTVSKTRFRQRVAVTALLLAFGVGCAPTLCGRDAFVMLSGGDSPLENNYSQYLQARAIVAWLERNYPPDSVWVFFGAGNVEGEKPVFGDVRRQVQRDGVTVDSWLPGSVSRNRAARRHVILRALREEILPAVAEGGTLYLFVGDHGSRANGDRGESIINLWSLERDPQSEHGWRSNDNESLGVAELRRALADGIGKGRVVFCMTQCHAGGFHHLAVPREMAPNPKWFTVVPAWARAKEQTVFLHAAGFTATDEFSAAAGCDPDPDAGDWAGYERFMPENLLGLDLLTLKRKGTGLRSFAEAHMAATLADHTIDKPYSTSEQYLERWANLIETRLAHEPHLTGKTKKLVAAYERTVDGATPNVSDRAFRERQSQFRRFVERLIELNPGAKELLRTGTRRELEEAIEPARGRRRSRREAQTQRREPEEPGPPGEGRAPGRRGGRSRFAEIRKLWDESIRPAWKAAVESDQVAGMPAAALEFEKYLLSKEAEGRDYLFGDIDELDQEIFWRSGYSDPRTVDTTRAEAIARWGAERRSSILAWAKTAEDEAVRAAAETVGRRRRRPGPGPTQQPLPPVPSKDLPIGREVAAERALFYRRVLAAWEFLLAMNERPALGRVRELTELERTPLPRPRP